MSGFGFSARRRLAFLLAGAASLAVLSDAVAADMAGGMEEVTVTARRRAERLQDVPDTISAFGATQIEDRGIVSLGDVARQVPNLDFRTPQQQGTAFITIRGVGMERFQDPSVALLVDGVQLTSSYQVAQDLFDLQRIEVLKGPQGALYGRNAIGGAINIVTKQPGDQFEGSVAAEYAEGNQRKLTASVMGPIIPGKLFFSIAGTWEKFDGLLDNVFLNRKVDFDDRKNLRARLVAKPTDDLTVDLRIGQEWSRPGAAYYIPLPDGMPNDTKLPIFSSVAGADRRIMKDYAAKVDYAAKFGTLTSITSYLHTTDIFFESLGYTPAPFATPPSLQRPGTTMAFPFGPNGSLIPVAADAKQNVFVHSWSQELRFTSPSEQRLRYQLGGFVSTIKQFTETTGLFYLFGPQNPLALDLNSNHKQDFVWALFGQVNYDLMPNLELTLAMRYDRQDKKQTGVVENIPRQVTFSDWQPKASLAYKWTPDVMTYFTVAKGFRGGGFNNSDVAGRVYKSESLWNYELGAKTSWFDRKLTVNTAAFLQQYKDRQEYVLDLTSGGSQILFNIPKTQLYGLELEVASAPMTGLQIDGGLGYLHSEITDIGHGFRFANVRNGNKVPYVPDLTANLGVQYTVPLNGVSLTGRVDVSHKRGLHWALDNVDKQSAVTLVNLRLTAEFEHGLSLTFYGRNLFDKRYSEEVAIGEFTGLFNADGRPFDVRYPSRPRQFGVIAKYRF